jgi:hypothetical protein
MLSECSHSLTSLHLSADLSHRLRDADLSLIASSCEKLTDPGILFPALQDAEGFDDMRFQLQNLAVRPLPLDSITEPH